MQVLVHGDLPKGSGLSSSSAFVCGAAVALLYANNIKPMPTPNQIAQICIDCERYVGVMSGGMDQSICMMAEKGKSIIHIKMKRKNKIPNTLFFSAQFRTFLFKNEIFVFAVKKKPIEAQKNMDR